MDTQKIVEQTIKDTIAFFIEEEPSLEVSYDEATGAHIFGVTIDNPKALIGQNGATLSALQHLVKKIVERKATEGAPAISFVLDVNNYQTKKIEVLKSKVSVYAERARSFKNDIPLEPMSSYERLLVHTFLADEGDLKTESHGEGPNRHIVIKYLPTESID